MMWKFILIGTLAGLLATSQVSRGQSEGENYAESIQEMRVDTIYFFDQDPMCVNVMKITYDSVIYRETDTSGLEALGKDRINKIKYNWGRLEILNKKPSKKQERYDWRKVKILEDENRVSDMYKVKEIKAKAEGNSRGYETPKSLELKARTILRKKAANVNAPYVLITNKTITTAFGELPSATLSGIAYSDKQPTQTPPQENESAQEQED